MKKILLIALALTALTAQGRKLTFYLGDEVIKAGEILQFNKIDKEDTGAGFDVTMQPDLYLESDILTSNVTITATCTSGQSIQMCASGACTSGVTVNKTGVTIQSYQRLPLEFEYLGFAATEQEIPEVITDFVAVDPKYEQTRTSFTLVMNPTNSVVAIYGGDAAICAVKGTVEYQLDTPSTLTLTDTAGRTVLRAPVEGTGRVDTTHLPQGVYVYTCGALTGKLYIH